jgi:hypothetical protein
MIVASGIAMQFGAKSLFSASAGSVASESN